MAPLGVGKGSRSDRMGAGALYGMLCGSVCDVLGSLVGQLVGRVGLDRTRN